MLGMSTEPAMSSRRTSAIKHFLLGPRCIWDAEVNCHMPGVRGSAGGMNMVLPLLVMAVPSLSYESH